MTINNSNSDVIKAWQSFLYGIGIHEVGTADGYWGPDTTRASKKFQGNNGLHQDGIVGTRTISAAEKQGFEIPKSQQFNPHGFINAIFDISDKNPQKIDFKQAKDFGMKAVFHKATQSTNHVDPDYYLRKGHAQKEGLLWGAYHFGAGKDAKHGDGKAQAIFFLNAAKPDGKTILALDLETDTTPGQTNMTLDEVEDFINTIKSLTGKYPVIYGNWGYLSRLIGSGGSTLFSKCPLWLSSWGTKYSLPASWSELTFWQFTDGKHGPGALPIPGVGHCDRDLFQGTETDLNAFWAEHSVHYPITA